MKTYYTTDAMYERKLDMRYFLSVIDSNKMLYSHIAGINSYIENWKLAFSKTYDLEKEEKMFFLDGEYFYTSICVGDDELRIHFDIELAKQKISMYRERIQNIPLYLFDTKTSDLGTIQYSYCSEEFSCVKSTPIILVPYCIDGFQHLTIDGNHRISKLKRNHISCTNVIILDVDDVLPLIHSKFEQATYCFLYEGINVEHFINCSASQYFMR